MGIVPVRRAGSGLIDKNAKSRALQIIELTRSQSPEEGDEPTRPKQQRHGDQNGQNIHEAADRSRSALATTTMEEHDIATAAISGVTNPARASGIARML